MAELPARRRPQRILVVDDNPDNILLTRELLGARGYEVITATTGEAALAVVHAQHPDLILLDVVLPGKSGYDICRELKDDPETKLIPVIMITGLTDREDRIRGIDAGADEFLNKPIFPEELFARVRSLLRIKEFTDELERVETVLFTLARGVEARDPSTEGHCERLSRYAARLGEFIGLDGEHVIALHRGGVLHDLGKISIPDHILKKGSNLTPEEWTIMRQHPVIGENIVRPLKSMRLVLPIIRNHHEHWDGSGYPDKLSGEQIPLLARVLQVVDVYDALRTARPYKPALSHEESEKTMLAEAKSGLWDRHLVKAFFDMLRQAERAA